MDFVADLATPLPVLVIAELLGWPDQERHRLRPWSARIVRLYEKDHTTQDEERAESATTEFAAMLTELAAERRATPRDDLISALVAVCDEGDRLTADELISTCMLLLNAGHEATANAAGNGLWALLRHPEQMRRLRAEASMLPAAVDEMLRYDAPLQLFHRYVLEDLEFGGFELRRGEMIGLLYGRPTATSGLRPRGRVRRRARAEPASRVRRLCTFLPGRAARAARAPGLVETLLRRLPMLRLDGEQPRYRPGLVFRGLESLNIRW